MRKSLKVFFNDVSKFRIFFVVETIFFSIAFLNFVSIVFHLLTVAWGVYLIVKIGFFEKKLFNIRHFNLLAIFVISNFITAIINIRHNFFINLGYTGYAALVLCLFFGVDAFINFENIKIEMLKLFNIVVYINSFFILASLLTIFLPESFFSHLPFELGIYRDNRLTGVFYNPNILGFHCAVSFFMASVILMSKVKAHRVFLYISLVIDLIALFLSDSNASLLFLMIYVISLIFCKMFTDYRSFDSVKVILNIIFTILLTAFVAISSVFIRSSMQKIVTETVKGMQRADVESGKNESAVTIDIVKGKEEEDESISFGRKPGAKGYKDISSGRIDLLKQGLKIFLRHPTMGVGRANLNYYGQIYLKNGLRFEDLHNGYLTILVCSGVVGFCIFLIFGVKLSHEFFSLMFKNKDRNSIYNNILAGIMAYCVYSLFEKTILNEMTFMALFFWLLLGYADAYYKESLKEN